MPDEYGVSVYRERVLREDGLSAADLIRDPMNGVVSVTAQAVRSFGLGVVPDAWPESTDDPNHRRNAAHALIKGLERLGKKRQQKLRRSLACVATFLLPDMDNR